LQYMANVTSKITENPSRKENETCSVQGNFYVFRKAFVRNAP